MKDKRGGAAGSKQRETQTVLGGRKCFVDAHKEMGKRRGVHPEGAPHGIDRRGRSGAGPESAILDPPYIRSGSKRMRQTADFAANRGSTKSIAWQPSSENSHLTD
jgi:hypothetical protein